MTLFSYQEGGVDKSSSKYSTESSFRLFTKKMFRQSFYCHLLHTRHWESKEKQCPVLTSTASHTSTKQTYMKTWDKPFPTSPASTLFPVLLIWPAPFQTDTLCSASTPDFLLKRGLFPQNHLLDTRTGAATARLNLLSILPPATSDIPVYHPDFHQRTNTLI